MLTQLLSNAYMAGGNFIGQVILVPMGIVMLFVSVFYIACELLSLFKD